MNKVEEWKWIKGYEGRYEISDYGRVKSYLKDESGYVLSIKNKYGWYLTLRLTDSSHVTKTHRIHVLVASHFIGNIPKGYHVHHKDGNRQNNHVDNLEILHPTEHSLETYTMNPSLTRGINRYNKYIKAREIYMYSLDGEYLASFPNSVLAEQFTGVCQRNILQVANHEQGRKQAGGYIWSFERW